MSGRVLSYDISAPEFMLGQQRDKKYFIYLEL